MDKKKMIFIAGLSVMAIMTLPLEMTWLTCLIYLGIIVYLAYLNNETTLIGFCFLIVFQNIILIIFSKYISRTYMLALLAIKELLIYITILRSIWILIKEKKIKQLLKESRFAIVLLSVFFASIIINSFKTSVGVKSIIFSIRQMCIPVVCIVMGYLLNIKKDGFVKVKKIVVILSLLLAIIGIVEMFLPENIIWQTLNYGEFLKKKQEGAIVLYKGVTGNFYTWDFGFLLRRLVSFTADPLATSHIIVIGILTLLFLYKGNDRKGKVLRTIGLIILIMGCILGFSKGSFIYLAIMIICLVYHKFFKNVPGKVIVVSMCGLFIVGFGVICVLYFSADNRTAITIHIDGLIKGLRDATLFGNGMGMVGAANSAITGVSITNAESYLGVCVNQIGYVGIISVGILWVILIINNVRKYFYSKDEKYLLMIILLVGLTVDMILSESSVAIIGTGIYFIYIGIFLREENESKIS